MVPADRREEAKFIPFAEVCFAAAAAVAVSARLSQPPTPVRRRVFV